MSDYVYLPVPVGLLTKAVSWLDAQLQAENGPAPRGEAESESWTIAERQRAYTESSPNMRAVIDYLAGRPGLDVPTATIAEHMGVDPYQFRAIAGAFGKRVWHRYGKSVWPFDSWRRDGITYYRMSSEIASALAPVLDDPDGAENQR